jgi:hypothetical protein
LNVDPYASVGPWCVSRDISQRFLEDPVGGLLERGGERFGVSIDRNIDVQARFSCPIDQPLEARSVRSVTFVKRHQHAAELDDEL